MAAFLILEPRFPRSVRYCATSAKERIHQIRADGDLAGGGALAALAALAALDAWLAKLEPDSLRGPEVHAVLTRIVGEIHTACDVLGREIFGDAAPLEISAGPVQAQSQ